MGRPSTHFGYDVIAGSNPVHLQAGDQRQLPTIYIRPTPPDEHGGETALVWAVVEITLNITGSGK